MTDEPLTTKRLFLPDLLMTVLLRGVALACLWYALNVWSGLIGYANGGADRFDLLGSDMKAAASTLAILYPVAAIGLWLRGSWGPVIWVVAAMVEIVKHEVYSEIFGADRIKVLVIAATALLYIALRIAIRVGRQNEYEHSLPRR
ncbi:DUF6163 family protein [Rhizobium alvei]|uniref:DUF6163 family protein n=1 Tax=Rhizobium alvei TaxID=1132659 RepID=A0ABT8YJB5_9HYPH|nr:DUF6163 family protein [Rhizobium alvei]MDO6963762.1 DUF6163 family protein [Rhizobium alvei]